MLRLAATSRLSAALTWTALAEDADGRYRMFPTYEGFLKLDTRSGAVRECKRVPQCWAHLGRSGPAVM